MPFLVVYLIENMFPVAVINTIAKSNLVIKRFISTCRSQSIIKGRQGRNRSRIYGRMMFTSLLPGSHLVNAAQALPA